MGGEIGGTATATDSFSYVGGIVGYSYGIIADCINFATMTAKTNCVGGIVGRHESSEGKTYRCINYGVLDTSGCYVGGIIGYLTKGTVDSCVNKANFGSPIVYGRTGGICGRNGNNTIISNCYNMGNGIKDAPKGGIIGEFVTGSKIENCYSVYSERNGFPVVFGGKYEGIYNCYYNIDICSANEQNAEGLRTRYMKSVEFVGLLGNAFKMDTEYINGGYPVLTWERTITNPFEDKEKEGKEKKEEDKKDELEVDKREAAKKM